MHAEDLDLCGEIIDSRYRVECRIGQGGMGVVWRVRHLQTRQLFALKTVNGHRTPDRKVLRRLLHEARATASIQSRNVVRIVDVKSDYVHMGFDLPFIVMEFLRGSNLSDYLQQIPVIELGELIWITRQVSHALYLAHERGIIHRDLKPSNIFLAEDDDGNVTVKLCDFGIAKLQGADIVDLAETGTLTTETGALFGTPRYMAPEQMRRAGTEAPTTDQWALGLIVFRALTGRSYFESARNLAELILAIVHEPLPAPSSVSPLSPKALDAWFIRCCARNPSERFETVEIQQQHLEEALGLPAELPILAAKLRSVQPQHTTSSDIDNRHRSDRSPEFRSTKSRAKTSALYIFLGIAGIASFASTHWIAARIRASLSNSTKSRPASVSTASASFVHPTGETGANAIGSTPDIVPLAALPMKHETNKMTASHVRSLPRIARPNAEAAPSRIPRLLPRGAECVRSAQCKDGLCAAEVCQ